MIAEREKAKKHIFEKMMSLLTEKHQLDLDGLLVVEETKFSKLQQLKHPPNNPSSQGILKLIDPWLSGKFSHAFNLVINRFSYLTHLTQACKNYLIKPTS